MRVESRSFRRRTADTIAAFYRAEDELGCWSGFTDGGRSAGDTKDPLSEAKFLGLVFFTLPHTDQLSRRSTVSSPLVLARLLDELRGFGKVERNRNLGRKRERAR